MVSEESTYKKHEHVYKTGEITIRNKTETRDCKSIHRARHSIRFHFTAAIIIILVFYDQIT